MKKIYIFAFLCIYAFFPASSSAQIVDTNKQLKYCHRQVNRALDFLSPFGYYVMPRNILNNDKRKVWNCRPAVAEEWCSGFWPGILWMDWQFSKDENVLNAAKNYTATLDFLADQPVYDHDLGFITINAFLKGYEQTHDEHYRQIALACADTLATLFNPKVGTLLSWPRHVKDYKGHNTIIDNMMNLELLFWAAENGGDQRLREMAVSHARTTMKHQFQSDGTCYHVAVYNPKNGKFKKALTHQGYDDDSMWARGQAWAVYAFTTAFRFTHEQDFLNHAMKVTDIYLKRLQQTSDDWIPIWDMDDPRGKKAPKDASAAAIVASALLELFQYVDQDRHQLYFDAAVNMLAQLSTDEYLSGEQNVAFLKHATGHHPAGYEIDASIIYADYYYIEALLRLNAINP